ncbi:TELO2-interacting protein 1 [Caerostris extrusa]|uniref:TELO2-interacting protein 1 n=1 Tax=Caerostris extrusa TaxID=172846 RepID=A0AAV4PUM3_CAEEX|nr:TELO2-interacting protein 1 [Caerostris extrusa]
MDCCKLQLCVLSKIGSLLCKLNVAGKNIVTIAEACLPYLQSKQPKITQSAAFQTFEDLARIDPDAIWWYINQTYSQSPIMSPSDTFKEIHFPFAKVANFEIELNL